MVVGFNHNVRYREQMFHVQTEDSGLKNPHIITLLYYGGTIIASKKTSYADITKVDNLEAVVEDLMKEQHKEMLRRLKGGEFDRNIQALLSGKALPNAAEGGRPDASQSDSGAVPDKPPDKEKAQERTKKQQTSDRQSREPADQNSLDEIILSYLVGDDKKK